MKDKTVYIFILIVVIGFLLYKTSKEKYEQSATPVLKEYEFPDKEYEYADYKDVPCANNKTVYLTNDVL